MIWDENPYVTYDSLMTMIGWRRQSAWWSSQWRRRSSTCIRRRARWAVMKNLKKQARSREDRFSKTLFAFSRCKIAEHDGSGDLLSQSQMHVDEQNEVALAAQQRRRRKTRCVGGSWLFVVTSSMVAARIYRKDPPKVTASCNWLALSLSKRIRQTRSKNKWQKEVEDVWGFGPNFDGYSCAHRAPAPLASPHHTPARRARAHMYFFFSPLLHTLVSV
jgi:hypothetical protein